MGSHYQPASALNALPGYLDRVSAASRQRVADGHDASQVLDSLCTELAGLATQIRQTIDEAADTDGA